MTKNEVIELADKIVLGTATEDEIKLYARICTLAENTASETVLISAEEKAALEDAIKEEIFRKTSPAKVYRLPWIKWAAVAASIILVISLSWLYYNNSNRKEAIAQQPGKKTDSVAYTLRHEINTTGADKYIALTDGSLIILANNSEVSYREPFDTVRNILLSGKAYFKVAKDKTKPFIVTSGDITTTALGTAFTVTAFEKTKQITVRLHEGKVVIKPVDKQNAKMKQDVYLLPGQEFVYNSKGNFVRSFQAKNVSGKQVETGDVQQDSLAIPEGAAPYFMFNNQSLDQVLDNLSAIYNVKIVYHKKDVQNIAFTGKYDKTASLESILELIGKLNQLTITKNDSAYTVSR